MSDGLALGYAFGLGMVAVFNPCGFAMLPAWLAYFVTDDGLDGGQLRSVQRAIAVSITLTAGFVVVFLTIGLVISAAASTIVPKLPWLSIVLGLAMVVFAASLLRGREVSISLPWSARGPRARSHRDIFAFGMSYALVSVACTIPLFLAAITSTLTAGNFGLGMLRFVAYAVGMGLVLTVLTLAVALARSSVVSHMRRVLPHVRRIAAVLLGVAGLYVAYYGWYQLRVYDGATDPGGPAKLGYQFSANATQWIMAVGPLRVGIIATATIGATIAAVGTVRWNRSRRSRDVTDEPSVSGRDPGLVR